jgi:hypothetical protein
VITLKAVDAVPANLDTWICDRNDFGCHWVSHSYAPGRASQRFLGGAGAPPSETAMVYSEDPRDTITKAPTVPTGNPPSSIAGLVVGPCTALTEPRTLLIRAAPEAPRCDSG